MVRMRECRFIILDRGANQSFSRLQMFRNDGEYISRMSKPYMFFYCLHNCILAL